MMELKAIASDVYTCLQEDRGLGTSNSGFIRRGGGLVVDTFWDLPHTQSMIDLYSSVASDPARRVVNTHHNGDHCWGNQLFGAAEIIGHRRCAEAFGRESPELMQALRGAADSPDAGFAEMAKQLAAWDFSGIRLTPPTTLIDERLDLDLDGIPVEILYVGPAHTSGDVIVHLPEQRIVFTGDVLFRLCTPIGWDGTYAQWDAALDRVIALAPETIVPGHGPLCDREGAREMKVYLQYVRSEAKQHYDAGRNALDAAKRIDLGPYADWTEPERLYANVERAYREFRGEPWDAPIDPLAMFNGIRELRQAHAQAQAHTH